MSESVTNLLYLVTIVTFILALRFLSSPRRARQGNLLGAAGMALAIAVTLAQDGLENYGWMALAMAIGAVVGVIGARQVEMTAMPQMVAIFNGMGGATAALVSVGEFSSKSNIDNGEALSIVLGTSIGSISFTGSMIAFLKLQGNSPADPSSSPTKLYNAILFGGIVVLGALAILLGDGFTAKFFVWIVFFAALALGVMLVLPIGGADMPVVIAILNSLTGLAAALAGLVLSNQAMVIAGALVGASGSL